MRKPAVGTSLSFVPPMLPTLVDEPPEGSEWIHEIKYDGWRCQIVIDADGTRVFTRNGHNYTAKLPPIAKAAAELPAFNAIIDGELILPGADAKPDFGGLKAAITAAPGKLAFVAFDLLHWNGKSFLERPLTSRRKALWSLVEPASGRIQFSGEHGGPGAAFFAAVDAMGLEGIVSKRADSAYRSGRTRDWVKIKTFDEATYDIIGVQREPGQPAMVLMADQGRYKGGAFVTLPRGIRDRLWARVQEKAGAPPLKGLPAGKAEWVKPGLRGRVKFLKGEESLRHASLQEWTEE